jgi:UDP-GlcNAc3NAcA epimerase
MIMSEKYARLILTDSGGVQKEAYFYRVPCVIVREETEWIELVEIGWNRLQPPWSSEELVEAVRLSLSFQGKEEHAHLYGLGDASQRIADILFLSTKRT